MFTVYAELEGKDLGEALDAIFEEIEKVKRAPVSIQELRQARARIEAQGRMADESVEWQAIRLIIGEQYGDYQWFEEYYDRVKRVSRDDIMRVAREHLTLDNCTIVGYMPSVEEIPEQEMSAAELEGRLSRAMGKVTVASAIEESTVEKIELDSGITLLLKENHSVPIVAVSVLVPGGVKYETARNNGISNLMQEVLLRGTERRSGSELADELALLGADLYARVGHDFIGYDLNIVSEDLENGMEILADVIMNPAFDDEEIERERQEVLAKLKTKRNWLHGYSQELCDRAVYGEHPYGLPVEGNEDAVARLTQKDLRAWHKKFYLANNLVISVVGDIDRQNVRAMVEETFAPLRSGKIPKLQLAEIALPDAPREVGEELDKHQTHLVVGMPGPGVPDPDYYPFQVLNDVLSGMGSRLFMNLRDAKGLAYTVYSYLSARAQGGAFKVYIGTSPEREEEAIAGILDELRAVRDDGVTDEEFKRAKDHLIGQRDVQLQRNATQARLYASAEIMGTGFDAVDRYQERIADVTMEDVARVAGKYIDIERYSLGIIRGTPGESGYGGPPMGGVTGE
jgi:zinc protease